MKFAIFGTSDKGMLPDPGARFRCAAKWDDGGQEQHATAEGDTEDECIERLLAKVFDAGKDRAAVIIARYIGRCGLTQEETET